MSEARQDIDEAKLHAYVDGLLDEDRRMAVESVLADDADATETARTYREQNSQLTTLFGDITGEPIPERLSVDRIVRSGVWWRPPQFGLLLVLDLVGAPTICSGNPRIRHSNSPVRP